MLSPFVVTSRGDNAYKPSHSNSAGLINQAIIESPFTLTAISAQALADAQVLDLAEIRALSATLDQSAGGRGFGSEFNSRGFRTETLNNGHRTRQFMDNALIDIVEVVNGPMATVYGESGAGGVVAISTKAALPGKRFGSIAFTAGDEHLRRGVVDFNLPLPRASALRLIAYRSDTDSHIMRWFDNKKGAYLAAHSEPLAWLTLNARADYLVYDRPNNTLINIIRGTGPQYLDRDGDGFREFDFPNNYGAGPYYYAGPENQLWRWKQGVASGEAIATLGNSFSARLSALYLNQDQDGVNGWSSLDSFTGTPKRARIDADRERETKSFKIDLLYQWEAARLKLKGKLLAGAEYYRASDRETYFEYQNPTAPLFVPWPPAVAQPSDYFLPSESEIRSTWTLNSSLSRSRPYRDDSNQTCSQRLTSIVEALDGRVRLIAGYRFNTGAFKQNVNPVNGEPYKWIPFDKDTYQYGVSGDLLNRPDGFLRRVTAYYSFGTTFIPPRQGNPVGLPDVQPEQGSGWDAGLKFEAAAGKLTGEIAHFDLKRDNVLVVVFPPSGGSSYFVNAGSQQGDGYQLALNYAPTKPVNLGVQWMHLTGGVVYDSTAANIGLPLTSPRDKFTVQARYEFLAGGLKGFSVGANLRYTADTPAHGFNNTQRDWIIPANTVCGLNARYQFAAGSHNVVLAAAVDNVFDALYLDRMGDADFTTGAPRNVKFTIEYKF